MNSEKQEMATTQTVAELLDEQRQQQSENWPKNLSDSESRVLIGLRQLEVYTAIPAAAWAEGVFSESELEELVHADIFENIAECTRYIDAAIHQTECDPKLLDCWRATSSLVHRLRKSEGTGNDFVRKSITLFGASIALRAFFEMLVAGVEPKRSRFVVPDGKRVSVAFFSRVKSEPQSLSIPICFEEPLVSVIAKLPTILRNENWI